VEIKLQQQASNSILVKISEGKMDANKEGIHQYGRNTEAGQIFWPA